MVKGSSSLCSVLVSLAITFAVAFETNISYQIGEVNNKLTYLQGRLDLFDYITEGNVSVLQHRVAVNDSKCAENVTKQFNVSNGKLNALESKFNALATTVSSNVSTLLHRIEENDLKYAENIALQFSETNENGKNLANKMDLVATDVSKLNILESKFNALATTVSSNVSKYAENVNVQIDETNVKLNDLADKLNALATKITNLVGVVKKKLLKPSSCEDAFVRPPLNRGSGVYNIQLNGNSSPFDVFCMADPKGGLPWTVVQRRVDGTVDFFRNWTEYQRGFGDLEGNFFIGLDKLHSLTTEGDPQELWVMLTDRDGISAHAYYDRFAIGNETEKYPLEVLGEYSGDAGDSLSYHKSMKFSTYDNENDFCIGNCAEILKSAWWFNHSMNDCHLNGVYESTKRYQGLIWYRLYNNYDSMKYAHMANRPARK